PLARRAERPRFRHVHLPGSVAWLSALRPSGRPRPRRAAGPERDRFRERCPRPRGFPARPARAARGFAAPRRAVAGVLGGLGSGALRGPAAAAAVVERRPPRGTGLTARFLLRLHRRGLLQRRLLPRFEFLRRELLRPRLGRGGERRARAAGCAAREQRERLDLQTRDLLQQFERTRVRGAAGLGEVHLLRDAAAEDESLADEGKEIFTGVLHRERPGD